METRFPGWVGMSWPHVGGHFESFSLDWGGSSSIPWAGNQAVAIIMHSADVTSSNEASEFSNILFSLLIQRKEVALSTFLPDLPEWEHWLVCKWHWSWINLAGKQPIPSAKENSWQDLLMNWHASIESMAWNTDGETNLNKQIPNRELGPVRIYLLL